MGNAEKKYLKDLQEDEATLPAAVASKLIQAGYAEKTGVGAGRSKTHCRVTPAGRKVITD